MAFQSGHLRHRVTFQARKNIPDELGNPQTGAWEDRFGVAARIAGAKGREEVFAQRLEGTRPTEILVRWSRQTATIMPDWRAVNARNPSEIYNIHDVRDPDGKQEWLVITCTMGKPT